MADKENPGGGEGQPQFNPEEFKKLTEQVENLNKGIASYRDQLQTKTKEMQDLKSQFDVFKKEISKKDDDGDDETPLNPEEQKKLEAWAKQKGFVSQEELNAEKQRIQQENLKSIESQAVSEFLEKHKEYDKDEEWAKVQAEFGLYKTPTTLEGYRKLLNKIHSEISDDPEKAREDGKAQARAELITKGRLSLGGGSQGGDGKGPNLEDYQKRYPNLSKDQIMEKLHELKSLYPEKKNGV